MLKIILEVMLLTADLELKVDQSVIQKVKHHQILDVISVKRRYFSNKYLF